MKNELKEKSIRVRENILKMSKYGGAFIGSALSCCDLILYLYDCYLNINKTNLKDPNRDFFFLSKGHAVPALYSVLIEENILDNQRIHNHLSIDDNIYLHPNRNIPGIEYHSGSLGHLISISIGVSLDLKLKNANNKVVCLMGDGELNEGTCWEGFLIANAYNLDNLTIIIDRNKIQANKKTEELIPLEPLEEKIKSFGLNVISIDGHNFLEIENALNQFYQNNKSKVIIANTIRGKYFQELEDKVDKWFCKLSENEIENLINNIRNL